VKVVPVLPADLLTKPVGEGRVARRGHDGVSLAVEAVEADNDQSNELALALGMLAGARVQPGSDPDGYFGVQLAANPTPSTTGPTRTLRSAHGLLRERCARVHGPGGRRAGLRCARRPRHPRGRRDRAHRASVPTCA
jgi:hypothetical protein